MADDVAIADFLAEVGFNGPEAQQAAREALEAAGLTRPGKLRFAMSKIVPAREVLETRWVRLCSTCNASGSVAADRPVIEVPADTCTSCQGSPNRRAVQELVQACVRAGIGRILIVGGTPVLHNELLRLAGVSGGGLRFRCIDGAEGVHTRNEATAHLNWAEIAVVWASTPLPHKVSEHYTRHPRAKVIPMVTCRQRGIAALASTIITAVAATASRK